MRAEVVLLGRRVDMALRTRRRALVVLIYAAIAAIMIGMWFADQWRTTGTYIFWATILACRLFLGGIYAGGLVKPFTGKGPKQYDAAPPLLALKLRIYQPVLDGLDREDPSRAFRNDERELKQRDRSHYYAYQAIGVAVVIAWFAAYMGMLRPAWLSVIPMTPFQLFYALTMATLMLFLTLPQCILLWTEPDMEPELAPDAN